LRARVIEELNLCARPTVNTPEANRPLAIWAYTGLVAMEDGDNSQTALNAVAKFRSSKNVELRVQAAHALGALGKKAKGKLPVVLAMLQDPEVVVIQGACAALVNIGETGDEVVRPLLDLLAHKDPARASAAVAALVGLRVNTNQVLNTLDTMRENKD